MLGAIIGDIVGSTDMFRDPHGGEHTPLISEDARMTGTTVCLAAVADTLLQGHDPTQTLQAWRRRHSGLDRWGDRLSSRIAEDTPAPYESWGSGGAMQASPVGLLAKSEEQVLQWANRVTAITHDHPESLAAARAVALTVYWCRQRQPLERMEEELKNRFSYDLGRTLDDVRSTRKPSRRASDSVPEAILCGLRAESFEDALRKALSVGRHADTMCTIAGAIAESRFGVPSELGEAVRGHLTPDVVAVIDRFYEVFDVEAGQVWHCGAKDFLLRLECPMEWMQLAPTADTNIRHCDHCDRDVHFCTTPEEFIDAAKADRCVALPVSLQVPLSKAPRCLGMPRPWAYDLEDRARRWWDQIERAGTDLNGRQVYRDMRFTQHWSDRQWFFWKDEVEERLRGKRKANA